MIQSKFIHVLMSLTKRNIHTFDVLIFTQMRTDKNKFWQIRNASRNWWVQVRRDFDKWLCKNILRLSWAVCANKFSKVINIFFDLQQNNYKILTCSKSVNNHFWSSHLRSSYLRNSHLRSSHPRNSLTCLELAKPTFRLVQSRQK